MSAAMDTVDLVEGFFELPSDQTETILSHLRSLLYTFLVVIGAPVIRSLFERISVWNRVLGPNSRSQEAVSNSA